MSSKEVKIARLQRRISELEATLDRAEQSTRDLALENERLRRTLAGGSRLTVGGPFKLVYREELFAAAGPVKGTSGADRRAAQLIREAWNRLPYVPASVGAA